MKKKAIIYKKKNKFCTKITSLTCLNSGILYIPTFLALILPASFTSYILYPWESVYSPWKCWGTHLFLVLCATMSPWEQMIWKSFTLQTKTSTYSRMGFASCLKKKISNHWVLAKDTILRGEHWLFEGYNHCLQSCKILQNFL